MEVALGLAPSPEPAPAALPEPSAPPATESPVSLLPIIGRALLGHAMAKTQGAVLSVSEANKPARALYRSLGFRQTARRLVLERQSRPPQAATS